MDTSETTALSTLIYLSSGIAFQNLEFIAYLSVQSRKELRDHPGQLLSVPSSGCDSLCHCTHQNQIFCSRQQDATAPMSCLFLHEAEVLPLGFAGGLLDSPSQTAALSLPCVGFKNYEDLYDCVRFLHRNKNMNCGHLVMVPCNLVGGYQRCKGMYHRHLLKKRFICSSEMSVTTYSTTRNHNPDYHNPYIPLWLALNSKMNWYSIFRFD